MISIFIPETLFALYALVKDTYKFGILSCVALIFWLLLCGFQVLMLIVASIRMLEKVSADRFIFETEKRSRLFFCKISIKDKKQ